MWVYSGRGITFSVGTPNGRSRYMAGHNQYGRSGLVASGVAAAAFGAAMLAPVCATASPVAHAAAKVAFSGKYSGHASVTVSGTSVTISSVTGTGTGTDGRLSLAVKSSSSGCGSGNQISVKGSATVKGVSGKLKKAKGTVTFTGTYNKTTGNFTITISGPLSA